MCDNPHSLLLEEGKNVHKMGDWFCQKHMQEITWYESFRQGFFYITALLNLPHLSIEDVIVKFYTASLSM